MICLNRGIGELQACAADIIDLIDKDADITVAFNVIVYAGVKEREDRLEAAWVYERIALTAINENLASVLHSHGKTASHICVVFGELFDRGKQFLNSHVFLSETRALLWEQIGLPGAEAVHKMTDSVKARKPQSKGDALAWLTEGFSALLKDSGNGALIGRESYLFRAVANTFAEVLANKVIRGHETDLYEILEGAFTAVSDEQKNRYAGKFGSAQLRVDDSDAHKLNRCAYRLYLYVYLCAASEEVLPEIPEIRWEAFARILAAKAAIMEKERGQIQKIHITFPSLNIDAIGGEEIKPQYDSAGIYPIDEAVPVFTADNEPQTSLSFGKLRAFRNAAIQQIREKDKENEDKLDRFVRQVTKRFNDDKAQVFAEKRGFYRNADKPIANVGQTVIDVTKWKKETDGFIAGQRDLHADGASFREQIEQTQARTDHYLESVKRGRLIWVAFAAVLLVFLIPYLALRHQDLTKPYGGLTLAMTAGVIALTFWASCAYFAFLYKKLVLKALKKLRDSFNIAQRQRGENAKTYKQRLTHHIPRSIVLRQYYDDLLEFEKDGDLLARFYLYHANRLRAFENYIGNLARNLDIKADEPDMANRDDKTYTYILNPQSVREDVTAITGLYSLVDKDSVKSVMRDGGSL